MRLETRLSAPIISYPAWLPMNVQVTPIPEGAKTFLLVPLANRDASPRYASTSQSLRSSAAYASLGIGPTDVMCGYNQLRRMHGIEDTRTNNATPDASCKARSAAGDDWSAALNPKLQDCSLVTVSSTAAPEPAFWGQLPSHAVSTQQSTNTHRIHSTQDALLLGLTSR